MSTFNAVESANRRDDAIEKVDDAADVAWKKAASIAVRKVAELKEEFTTDAVWWWLEKHHTDVSTKEPRAMGAIMRKATQERICETVSRTSKSVRVECHRRPLQVYRSLVFKK